MDCIKLECWRQLIRSNDCADGIGLERGGKYRLPRCHLFLQYTGVPYDRNCKNQVTECI
jgi:hypothetical protein